MILPTDIPTRAQIDRLFEHRGEASVSIYVPTDHASSGEAEQIEFKGLAAEATSRLTEAGVDVRKVRPLEEALAELHDDEELWRHQARTLAVFATPESLITFRLPSRLHSRVEASERFYVKPLLRALTFPHVAFLLALAQGSVRLIEVAADLPPAEVRVPELPSDVASAVGKSSIGDRSPARRLQGAEGQKLRMRQYARQVDQALRSFLSGKDMPLILAATEPIESIYRSVSSYPHLLPAGIEGSPDGVADEELAASSRALLDQLYSEQLRDIQSLYGQRSAEERASGDVAEVARAATFGAVQTLLVDIDAAIPGTIDESNGVVEFAENGARAPHGVTDEIARRAWLSGAEVLAVREQDIPGSGPVAAILRYPL